jgi:hypothetical protein
VHQGGAGGGAVPSVAADEVVHAVPAVSGLGQQALAMQGIQLPGSILQPGAGQRGGGVGVDRGARVQAQAAEEILLTGGQVPVRHLECGSDAVCLGRQGEHARPGLSGQVGQSPERVPGVHAGQQRDRQRQEPGHPGQFCHCRGRAGAGAGGQLHEHLLRLAQGQGLQQERYGCPGQITEVAAAGDQHQTALTAGQQGSDLRAAGSVVQHEQRPLPGHPVPPQACPAVQIAGKVTGVDADGGQQTGQGCLRN